MWLRSTVERAAECAPPARSSCSAAPSTPARRRSRRRCGSYWGSPAPTGELDPAEVRVSGPLGVWVTGFGFTVRGFWVEVPARLLDLTAVRAGRPVGRQAGGATGDSYEPGLASSSSSSSAAYAASSNQWAASSGDPVFSSSEA